MALRHDADARLMASVDPKSIMPFGITGQYWVVGWHAANSSKNIGVIVEATEPSNDIDWEIPPPAVAEHIQAECTQQLAELEQALKSGKISSPYPESLTLRGPIPFGNFGNMAEAISELFSVFVDPIHTAAPAISPILAEVANRLHRNITLLTTTHAFQLARIDGSGLVATLHNPLPSSTQAMILALATHQKQGERMSALITDNDAEKLTTELMTRLKESGINPIITTSVNTAAGQLI
ncbi:MAG: hypothetical protein NT086_11175 [Proteobacteria bacterium]|nr:hypothetical protein [Pseudomonadota bacterium]